MAETVNHPAHYQGAALETRPILVSIGVELEMLDGKCIDAIESLGCKFVLGSAIKYLWNYGRESLEKSIEDLKNAQWYLDRLTNSGEEELIVHRVYYSEIAAIQRLIDNA